MINKLFLRLVPLLLVSVLACSSTQKHRSFGEVLDDGVISNKLKVRYMKDKTIKASQINIDTRRGVVSLKGVVDSQDQINRAIELAERQAGVREVKSYLMTRGGSPSVAGEPRKDKKNKKGIEERDIGGDARSGENSPKTEKASEPSTPPSPKTDHQPDPMELDDIDPPRVLSH